MSTLDLPLDPMTGYESVPDGQNQRRHPMDQDEPSLTTLEPRSDRFLARSSGYHGRWHHPSGPSGGRRPAPRVPSDRDPRGRLDVAVDALPTPLADLAEQALNAVAAALAEPPLDEDLWGAVPDDADIVREAVNAAVSDWRATEQLSRRSVAATEAAELLGLSVEELARWAARREVIAFDHAGDQWFPAWQFEADIERSQLAHLWRRFPGDAIWFSEWVHAPNPALGGAPPVERLQDGDLEAVVAAAEAITA